jgi:hypothetical protein
VEEAEEIVGLLGEVSLFSNSFPIVVAGVVHPE